MKLVQLIIDDERTPVFWANYKRLQISNINPYQPMGPNTIGEHMWPVVAVQGKPNRIGFSLIAPKDNDG